MQNEIDKLEGHAVICGYGRIGRMLASQLEAGGMKHVVIDQSRARLDEAEQDGCLAVLGEATEEEVLRLAGVERAKVLATVLPLDAANVFITLSARNLNAKLHIIARGEVQSTERKLHQAGANQVVLPAHIGAERIAHLILHPSAHELLDSKVSSGREFQHQLSGLGMGLEEIAIGPGSPWAKRTIAEVEKESGRRIFPVAVLRKDDEAVMSPPAETKLEVGDSLVVMCRLGEA